MTLTVYSKCIIIIVNTCPCLFVTSNVTKKQLKIISDIIVLFI